EPLSALSLHDALPICAADEKRGRQRVGRRRVVRHDGRRQRAVARAPAAWIDDVPVASAVDDDELFPGAARADGTVADPQAAGGRSEEHTSELQSRSDL